METITINGYRYGYWTRELIYSRRDDAYYRNSTDPLTSRLYKSLKDKEKIIKSPLQGMPADWILYEILFVCACLYEEDDRSIDLNKYLNWIAINPNESYFESQQCKYAKFYCGVYGYVLAALAAQNTLPEKVKYFMNAAKKKIFSSQWNHTFTEVWNTATNALNDGDRQRSYSTDLHPNVNLDAVKYLAGEFPSKLEPFLNPKGIRMVLSRIRNDKEREVAISYLLNAQRLSDPTQDRESIFAELRKEWVQYGKIEHTPIQKETVKKQPAPNMNSIAQMKKKLKKKNAEIVQLKREIARLNEKVNSQGKPTAGTTNINILESTGVTIASSVNAINEIEKNNTKK